MTKGALLNTTGPLAFGLLMLAGAAQGAPLTLSFSSAATGCTNGVVVGNAVFIEDGHCHDQNTLDLQYLTVGDTFAITSSTGAPFDFVSADMRFYWDELFLLPIADLPAGLDLTNPDDLHFVNQNWLWQSGRNQVPLISVRGYANGVLTQEFSDIFLDTESYFTAIGQTPDFSKVDVEPRDFPGAPMTGIDRLEIGFAEQFAGATISAPVLIGDIWYSWLPDGGAFVFDDLVLDIPMGVVPTPVPVPGPWSALLLGSALAGFIGMRRRH